MYVHWKFKLITSLTADHTQTTPRPRPFCRQNWVFSPPNHTAIATPLPTAVKPVHLSATRTTGAIEIRQNKTYMSHKTCGKITTIDIKYFVTCVHFDEHEFSITSIFLWQVLLAIWTWLSGTTNIHMWSISVSLI